MDTAIHSFVVRFVETPEQNSGGPPWHGVIRHVQSNTESRFAYIEEALAFMEGYVDLARPTIPDHKQKP